MGRRGSEPRDPGRYGNDGRAYLLRLRRLRRPGMEIQESKLGTLPENAAAAVEIRYRSGVPRMCGIRRGSVVLGLLGNKDAIVGVIDVGSDEIESADVVAERIRKALRLRGRRAALSEYGLRTGAAAARGCRWKDGRPGSRCRARAKGPGRQRGLKASRARRRIVGNSISGIMIFGDRWVGHDVPMPRRP